MDILSNHIEFWLVIY